jgi:hypothetical protein
MATKLGSLLIELGLDSAKFRSGTRQAQREMSQFQRGISSAANVAKGALVGMVSAISVDMFATAIKSGLDYASSLAEVAAQVGVTTKTLQEYRYAATQVGLTQDEMDASLTKLTRSIGQAANGGKLQAGAFERLGVSIRDANGNIKEAGVIIPEIADGLKALGSDAERAATLTEIFGRAGQKLAPLLSGGSSEINNLREAAHRLGVVLSDQQIQQADETADKLAAVKTVLQARLAGAVADNAGSIIELANALSELADKAFRAWAALRRFADSDVGRGLARINSYAQMLSPSGLIERAIPRAGAVIDYVAPAPSGAPAASRPAPAARPAGRTGWMGTPEAQRMSGGMFAAVDVSGILAFATGGAQDVAQAARTATPALRAMSEEVSYLLDRLNPVAAAQRELAANTELLNKALREGQITTQQHAIAVAQLRREYGVAGEGLIDWRDVIGDVGGASADAIEQMNGATWAVDSLADSIEASAERSTNAAERQQQALFDMLGSIRNFANGLKSGDVLGIVEGVFGILESVGSMRSGGLNIGGLRFGTGAASRIPRFAGGTNFAPGGMAWVGERGAELVNLPRGASVTPNHALKGLSGAQVQIVPSPYFDVVVDGRVMSAAPGIAAAGSQGAQMAMARRQTRRVA